MRYDYSSLVISSSERTDDQTKYECEFLKIVDTNKILVKISPSIPGYIFKESKDIELVVLAPRFVGTELTPDINELPVLVNICLPKNNNWDSGPYRVVDIGELAKK